MTKPAPKGVRADLYALLLLGVKPKILIAMGYPKGSVNKYHARLGDIRQALNENLEKVIYVEPTTKKRPKEEK